MPLVVVVDVVVVVGSGVVVVVVVVVVVGSGVVVVVVVVVVVGSGVVVVVVVVVVVGAGVVVVVVVVVVVGSGVVVVVDVVVVVPTHTSTAGSFTGTRLTTVGNIGPIAPAIDGTSPNTCPELKVPVSSVAAASIVTIKPVLMICGAVAVLGVTVPTSADNTTLLSPASALFLISHTRYCRVPPTALSQTL